MKRSDWDIDLAYGEEGEQRVGELLGELLGLPVGTKVEVKRERYLNRAVYIETEHQPKGGGRRWFPSGLSITKASHWVIVKADVIVIVPVSVLRRAVELVNQAFGLSDFGTWKETVDPENDNPTKGVVLYIDKLWNLP